MKQRYQFFMLTMIFTTIIFAACNSKKEEVKKTGLENKSEEIVVKTVLIVNADSVDNKVLLEIDEVNISKDEANMPVVMNDKIDQNNYSLSDSVEIFMQTFDYDNDGNYKVDQKILPEQFIKSFNNQERYKYIPFEIRVKGDKIVKITEKYIP